MDKIKNSRRLHDEKADSYPGTAVDKADDDHVDPRLVKQETCILNNNPRNEAIQAD